MELEFQAPVSDLMQVLGTELGSSERVVAALTAELSPQLFLNIFIYVYAVYVCPEKARRRSWLPWSWS